MDLFKLLGTISINNSDANKAIDETSGKGEKAESKLGKAFSAVGKGAVAVGKTIATGMAVGGAAVGALVTKSVQAYADYEQLVGGVDTLFKDSSAKVQEYAKNAYKTAGMSANEYMETVTSFSASLLQSLDGDTTKAAEKANTAITDMSDNANKMGTDMALIQNAYNGFAKQNYTMLDNLKLGYGGTKEEMQRLLSDAEKLSGQKFDLSSYADIVDAIHVVQTEMGITGTTAKEASSTISGSLASMKGAWSNLLTAISSDDLPFEDYVNAFVDSVSTVASNLLPRIEIALNGVVQLIDKLAPILIAKIPELLSSLLPSIITGATSMLNSIVAILPSLIDMLVNTVIPQLLSGITSIMNSLVNALPTVVQAIASALPTLIPQLLNAVTSMLSAIMDVLPDIISQIVEMLPDLLTNIVNSLVENIPILINGLTSMITELVNMLPTLIPLLLNAVVQLIQLLVAQIPILIPQLVNAVISIITLLGQQLPVLIPQIVNALVAIITILTQQLPVIIPMLIDAVILIIQAIIEQLPTILLALIEALPVILKAVWDAIVMIFTELPKWFGQLFQGAVDIIKTVFGALGAFFVGRWKQIYNTFKPVVDFFKNIFTKAWTGIKKAFSSVGKFFSGIWSDIKGAFSKVGSFFKDAFTGAWNAVKNVFSKVGSFFGGIWDTIKSKFSAIGTKIGDAVSGAVKKGINGLIGAAEKIINGFLKMINGAIGMINKIPGVNISKVKLVEFTRLAKGGVVDEPTPAIFGEDGAEAVVPLEKNTGWINRVAKQLHEFTLETKNNFKDALTTRLVELQQHQVSEMQMMNDKMDRIIGLLVQFFPEVLEALMAEGFVPNETMIAKWLAPAMDTELGVIAYKKGRGR